MLHRLKSSHHFMSFAVQVCATALGLLIALGIDQWKTNRVNQASVAQARTFIARELQTNETALDKEIRSLDQSFTHLMRLRGLLQAQLKGPVPKESSLWKAFDTGGVSLELGTLQEASWQASVANQAISHMDGWRVEKVARAFALQKSFLDFQNLAMNKVGIVLQATGSLDPAKPGALSGREAKDLSLRLDEFLILYQGWVGGAKELKGAYGDAIKACQAP